MNRVCPIPSRPIRLAALLLGVCAGAEPLTAQAPVRYARSWSVPVRAAGLPTGPVDVLVTSDCTLWVPDPRAARVHGWRCDGRALPWAGRSGYGPGEFVGLGPAVVARGDTLVVWDPVLKRLASFTSDGRPAGERRLEVNFAEHGIVTALAPSGPAARVATLAVPGRTPRPIDDHLVVWAVDADGRLERVAQLAGPPSAVTRDEDGATGIPTPFTAAPVALFSASGAMWRIDRSEGVVYRHPPGGAARDAEPVRLPLRRRPVTAAERARWTDSLLAAGRDTLAAHLARGARDTLAAHRMDTAAYHRAAARWTRFVATVPFPERHPAIALATLDERDRLWILHAAAPDGVRRWTVLDGATGRLIRTVDLPGSEPIVAADAFGDVLFVIETGADGVPRVARYRPRR